MAPPVPQFRAANFGAPVYDPKLKEVFFSNPGMGEVEAYSTEDGHRVGSVTVPGPLGLSLSPDNTLLAVGTSTPYVYFVDPSTLHITGQVEIPPSYLSLPGWGSQAVMPYLMANGTMLIAVTKGSMAYGNLISYDSVTKTFAQANPANSTPGYGIYGATPSRSLDGKYLVVPTGGLALYSADARDYVGYVPTPNFMTVVANPDGTQFATQYSTDITVFNRSLQQQYQYTATNLQGAPSLVFSRDGKYLYIRENFDIAALNAQTGARAGYKGLSIASLDAGSVSDADESYRVIGANGEGAFVVSAANLQPTIPLQLVLLGVDVLGDPNGGSPAGGDKVQLCTFPGRFDPSEEAYFGASPATSASISNVTSQDCLTATTPAASTNGPVTVMMTDANNNAVFMPNGYSYGPHLQWISPNAVVAPDTVQIAADGVWPYQNNVKTLTIGGSQLLVEGSVDPIIFYAAVHPTPPGWADLTLTFTDGSSQTVKNAVQFLAQDVKAGSGNYTSAVYDSLRDRFYIVGTNNQVTVFDPETHGLLQPMQSSLVSSNAVLGSVAITPDNSRLVVSDPTDRSVVVFDLASGTSVAANMLLSSNSFGLWGRMPVVTTNGNKAFVLLLRWEMASEIREIDLSTMTVRGRSDITLAGPGILATGPNSASSSGDGSMILFGAIQTVGATRVPGYAWKYDSTADAFSAPIELLDEQNGPPVVAVNADGSVLSAGINVLGQDLEPVVPFWNAGPLVGSLTASGALLYRASGAIEILDTRNGRSLLNFPAFTNVGADYATALAIDPSGRKILACGAGSLIYYELSVVPLAAATVTPSQAAPGQTVTVRGNGFVSGTSGTIGGRNAACSMLDDSTLQCVVPNVNTGPVPMSLTNPDGQTYSFENAMTVQ